jgi:hypothetical protein
MRTSTLMFLVLSLGMTPATAKDRTETVTFAPGATATIIRGSIRGYDGVDYSIQTIDGQVMQMLFSPSNRSCYFNVYAPGQEIGKSEATFVGSSSGNEFGVNPTSAGAYTAQVYLMRNAPRRREACRFRLSIEITGPPGGASAGISDRMLIDACTAAAAPMYGVEARRIRIAGKVTAVSGGGFRIDGVADKGPEGPKRLRCFFDSGRRFTHIQAMTSDGE